MRRIHQFGWLALASVALATVALAGHNPLRAQRPGGTEPGLAPAPANDAAPQVAQGDHPTPPPMTERAARVWLKLHERISMNFPADTPLEDVKKYIESSTQDEKAGFPTGLPIYVDPQGLREVDKTMASTVSINVEGIPLALTLKLLLKQLGLVYRIDPEGVLIVTSPGDAAGAGPVRRPRADADAIRQLKEEMATLRAEVHDLRRDLKAPGAKGR